MMLLMLLLVLVVRMGITPSTRTRCTRAEIQLVLVLVEIALIITPIDPEQDVPVQDERGYVLLARTAELDRSALLVRFTTRWCRRCRGTPRGRGRGCKDVCGLISLGRRSGGSEHGDLDVDGIFLLLGPSQT